MWGSAIVSGAVLENLDVPPLRLSGGKPILSIDDEDTHLMLLTRYLSKAGFTSIVAATGIEGLEVLKYNRPSLILLDLEMPGMDGFSFLAHLRNVEALRGVPVILQTAHVTKDNLMKVMKLGISGAITKPLDEKTLLAKVRQVLADQLSKRGSTPAQGSLAEDEAPSPEPTKPQGPSGDGPMSAGALEEFVEKATETRALPCSVEEVQAVISSDDSDAAELVEAIRQDPVLTATIIRIANSAEYGRGNTRSLDEAVTALGFQQVGKVSAQVGIMELADPKCQPGSFSCFNYWMHTLVVANLAERFAKMTGACEPGEALVAGLLHDLSITIAAQVRPDLLIDLAHASSTDPMQFQHDEKAALGWSFAQIGEKLMFKWAVPEVIAQAVGHHGDTKEGIEQLAGQARDLTLIIKAADMLAHAALTDPLQNHPILAGDDAMEMLLKRSKIDQEAINREVNAVVREAETLAMCNFDAKQMPPKLIKSPMGAVAVVKPDRMPASPLGVFLDKAANRVMNFRTMNEVTADAWDAIYIDGPTGGMRFVDRCLRDFSARKELHKYPTVCLATRDAMDTLKGVYGHLPVKLVISPCWARQLLLG